jgi:phage gpG-like protein
MPTSGPDVQFLTNARAVADRLNVLASKLDDPEPVLRRAQALIEAQEKAVWATEGAALGTHWAQAAEPQRKGDSRLLVASGRLRESLANQPELAVQGSKLVIGTSVEYGVFHQFGTSKMPARVFLGIAPELSRRLLTLFEESVAAQDAATSTL